MASEFQFPYEADSTVYVLIRNSSGQVWDTVSEAFVTFADADIARYDVPLIEQGTSSGYYVGDFPDEIEEAGTFYVVAYEQAGGSPAVSDEVVGEGTIDWTGTAEESDVTGGNLITIEFAKTALSITDDTKDAQLAIFIPMASQAIKTYCNREFVLGDYQEYYDPAQCVDTLVLRQLPVTSVTSVILYPHEDSAETFGSSDLIIDRKAGLLCFKRNNFRSFPAGFQTVRVDYSAGYSSIPSDIQNVCALLTGKLLGQSERDPNAVSEKLGDYEVQYRAYATSDSFISPDIQATLIKYRSNTL